MTQPRLGTKSRRRTGLREEHFPRTTMSTPPQGVDWFETITENLLDNASYGMRVFEHVAAHQPVELHGDVAVDRQHRAAGNITYLGKGCAALAERFQPLWISDHLCWTGVQGVNN